MAKILYIHQYFETPDESGRTRSYWFAKKLVEAGHSVTIVTSMHAHSKRKEGVYSIDGIKVRYVKNAYDNSMSVMAKVWSFIKFMLVSTRICLKEKDVDLVYATSTPLTVGIPAMVRKWFKKTPYIFEVRDLWPEFPIQVGAIKNSLLIKVLLILEKEIYFQSSHIIALSPGMQEGVLNTGVSRDKVSVIPNMSKPDLFYPRPCNDDVLQKYNIDLKGFNLIHFGTMGVANGLTYIIDAAEVLKKQNVDDVQIYFAGKGAMEAELKMRCQEKNLDNVHFLGYMNTYEISEVVNCCDATITTFKNLPILQTNSPNKLFDSLSAGKPCIVNSAGWTKDLVEEAKCGFYVNPEEPSDLAARLVDVKENQMALRDMGRRARELALNKYDKALLSDQFLTIIEAKLNG